MTSPAVEQQDMTPVSNVSPGSRREFLFVLGGLTLLYLIAVTIGNRRNVWFDELFTLDIARSPSLHELWNRELRFDLQTPTGYLLSRLSMWIFGPKPFGLRLPSMLEFYAGSVAILLYVRSKAGIAFATLAVLLLWAVSPTLYYAVEARPYALLLMSFACLLLSWDTAIRTQPRRLALFGVATSTLALAAAHIFAPFTFFAFIVAEAVRLRRRRVPDYALWAALLIPMLTMLIYIPLIRASGGAIFGVYASINTMFLFFEDTFGAPIVSFVIVATILVGSQKRSRATRPGFSAEEIALFVCLLLSPVLVNLALMHRHGTFYERYCVTAQVAIMVALSIFLAYHVRMNRWGAYAGSLLLLLFLLKTQVWHVVTYPVPRNAAFLATIQPNLPIVVAEGQVFVEMNHYETAALLSRVYFLKDPQASMRYLHTNIFQDFAAPDVMKEAGFPYVANVAPYTSFTSQHQQFLLLGTPKQWVFSKLRLSGASIAFLGDYKDSMPYMDTTLYLVTMPS
jgi:4-amino-4-deoxy-L-arabinose transferase-like glycosyltransferase